MCSIGVHIKYGKTYDRLKDDRTAMAHEETHIGKRTNVKVGDM